MRSAPLANHPKGMRTQATKRANYVREGTLDAAAEPAGLRAVSSGLEALEAPFEEVGLSYWQTDRAAVV